MAGRQGTPGTSENPIPNELSERRRGGRHAHSTGEVRDPVLNLDMLVSGQ
jgi:hypothetical protein